jgi:hypothetical protein
MVLHICHPSYAGEVSRRITVQARQDKNNNNSKTLPEN